MNITWKQIKAEIDGLPKTEKTLALKKMADGFEKELKEMQKKFRKEIYGDENFEGTTAISIEEILGGSK